MEVRVWRGGTEGAFQSFDVPRLPSQTVIDVVTSFKPSFRDVTSPLTQG